MKSTLFATLITFAMLAPAAAEQRQVPTNVTPAGVPAAPAPPRAEAQWTQLARYINTLPASHRAGHVNLMLNGFRYAADMQTTGTEDRKLESIYSAQELMAAQRLVRQIGRPRLRRRRRR